ncbi:cog2p [Saccharomyces arboricola H-6]|uniref:Conserved oligomeric Golgi complex subunit 2 n=1 Tax=Saccharomyces arboricola (strain H-6 / AS 2.3317 / CBS 10644) TaxID=1160507 RepID=J8LNF7_SACAR|nr:cog2p [Saccharomyces arboricola H-6]
MEFLNDDELDLDLPVAAEISKELFATEIENYRECQNNETDVADFDVDKFLMQKNLHYLPLDSLIRDLSGLSQKMVQTLLEQIRSNYDDFLSFSTTYTDEENETLLDLERTQSDLQIFMAQLSHLVQEDITNIQEIIKDVIEYLRKLDEIYGSLRNHSQLTEALSVGKKLSKSLHEMCGIEPLEEEICSGLIEQLYSLVTASRRILESFTDSDSPYTHHLRNDYQDLLQEFQISLKILTEKCLESPSCFQTLSLTLVLMLKTT